MSVLELRDVWKTYGRGAAASQALSGVTLDVGPGELLALVGASGSGKTTLLNLAAGLDRPTRGAVRLLGRPLADLGEAALADVRRHHVGFVFQALNLLPALTAAENIALPLAMLGMKRRARARRAADLLALAGLGDRGRAFPADLSIGQQQRVAVLRAVAPPRAVLFLDEPTSALDTQHAADLLRLILDLNQRERMAVVLATHDERVAERLSRRVYLRDGRIVA